MSRCYLREAGTAANDGARPQNLASVRLAHEKEAVVPILTAKNLVRNHTQVDTSAAYSVCRRPDCHAVFFSPGGKYIERTILKVRVGTKETDDPVPLCYCFGYTRRKPFAAI